MFILSEKRFLRPIFRAFMLAVIFSWMVLAVPATGVSADGITRVAVIPFQAIVPEDESAPVRCPVCGNLSSAGPITKDAEKILEERFTDKLRGVENIELVDMDKAAGVYQRIKAGSFRKPITQIITEAGGELLADVVVAGFLYRYRERIGYDYSAKRPASVAFEIHMISVTDGKTLWRGIFDKTQKSLMEDVFQAPSFFKGGAKWLTARELTQLGIDEVFSDFSGFEN